ncbi:MAG: relaxase domain-containing protein [Verrucomicrobiales bacterium]|nr:relaxase domain-containing protein [Verrucomicrobiales bacterium]
MLSIALAAGLGFCYYAFLAQENYYLRSSPGLWVGRGAEYFGLCGAVMEQVFERLYRGFSPDGSRALVQNAGCKDRRPALDLTWSVPKSLSALLAIASPEFREAAVRIIREVLVELLHEIESKWCFTRRGHAGKKLEPAQVIFALFEHWTSRALDPALHFHSVLINVGLRTDDLSTGALVTRFIFDHKMELGRTFRERLADRLERELGLVLERKNGSFEVKGVPKELCQRFSTRRQQILSVLNERGLSGGVAAKVACLDTREKKRDVPHQDLFPLWAEIGRQHEFERAHADALFHRVHQRTLERSANSIESATSAVTAGEAAPRSSLSTPEPAPVSSLPQNHDLPQREALPKDFLHSFESRSMPQSSDRESQTSSVLREPITMPVKEAVTERVCDFHAVPRQADSQTWLSASFPTHRVERAEDEAKSRQTFHSESIKPDDQRERLSDTLRTTAPPNEEEKQRPPALEPVRNQPEASQRHTDSPTPQRKSLFSRGLIRRQDERDPEPWAIDYRVRTTRNQPGQTVPDPGRVLFRLPATRFELRIVRDLIARHAPWWSPLHGLTLPKLVLARQGDRMDAPPRRYSLPVWAQIFGPITLSAHRMRVFPWAPAWSPVARLETRILALNRTRPKHAPTRQLPPYPRFHGAFLNQPPTKAPERPRPFELAR